MNFREKIARKLRSFIGVERNPRLELLKQLPSHSVCAEVGVWKGGFSSAILQYTSPEKLYLIDPWMFQTEFPNRMYGGTVAKKQQDMDKIYQDVVYKFANRPDVFIKRGFSEKELREFDNSYFDWIYIDGNHYYDFVMKDLSISFDKVKPGGFIAGDDYNWGRRENYPVKRAVGRLLREKGIEENLKVIGSQFVIEKPKGC